MPVILKTKGFNIDFLKLSPEERKQTLKALRFLVYNPRHPSLQTHKIEGTMFMEAYVNMDIRIIFERTSDTIVLLAVGHHDILKNL
ncbi:MAG: DNA helicase [Desulfitobacterium hafniense]|nr:DNA helicase [Desulfitobacterium hafniense]